MSVVFFVAVFCLKNFHSRFLLFINALPLKEQTDCANGEKTRSTPSHPQALVQEDGNVALGVLPKDRPTSQSEMVAACTVCGFNGIIADHLRLSKECVEAAQSSLSSCWLSTRMVLEKVRVGARGGTDFLMALWLWGEVV